MSVFAISDLHLDSKKEKPMDIFGSNWIDHDEKIFKQWNKNVSENDIVLLPGDISWAINLEESIEDFKKIDNLPGKKIIIRGNHDYWWSSKTKLNKLGFKTIKFIRNDCYEIDNIGIYGTRGWISRDDKDFKKDDEKIFLRELIRFENSLSTSSKDVSVKIAMVHYPPFNYSGETNEFVEMMIDYKIDICLYGHLHGEGHNLVKEGKIKGIDFHCVSSDYINFKPKEIL